MHDIPEEAVKAAMDAFHEAWNNNQGLDNELPAYAHRAALTAALPLLPALEPSAARELALGILPCWMCGADEASTYLGEPGPGAVKCFAFGCDAEISGFPSDKEAIAEWNRRSLAMDAAMTEAYCTSDENDLTECFQHHIRTSIGWQAASTDLDEALGYAFMYARDGMENVTIQEVRRRTLSSSEGAE